MTLSLLMPVAVVLLVVLGLLAAALVIHHRMAERDDEITAEDEQPWPPEAPSAYPAPPHPDGGTS